MSQPVISFIGVGNMASYIIKGLIQHGYPSQNIIATNKSDEALLSLKETCHIRTTTDNHKAAQLANIVILCVKPNVMKEVLQSISTELQANKPLLISIAAGISIESLTQWSGGHLPIVRAMPNLPVVVRKGITCLCANDIAQIAQKESIEQLFNHIGSVYWMKDEQQLDAATALAGSGPAYFYLFVEALTKGAIALGLEADTAKTMALDTGIGALALLEQTKEDPATMRKRVTSPNGTTAAALEVFHQLDLQAMTEKALQAALQRTIELSENEY